MQTSELAALTLAERLETMEVLWATLDTGVAQAQAMPAWHEAVVQERLQRLQNGTDTAGDLDEVFNRIVGNIKLRRAS